MGNNTDSQLVNCLCAHGIETTVPTLSTYIIFGIVGTILTRNQHKLKTNIKEIYSLGKKKHLNFTWTVFQSHVHSLVTGFDNSFWKTNFKPASQTRQSNNVICYLQCGSHWVFSVQEGVQARFKWLF